MKKQNNRVDVKIVILGDQNVGKSTLIQRFVHEKFVDKHGETIGAAFAAKEITSHGRKLILGIWDTAGTERYRAMAKMFYRDAKAAIVCFDITNYSSWDGLRRWITELRDVEENCKVYICGTKKDLVDECIKERDIPIEKTTEYARGIQVRIVETSSKSGENVAELFTAIVDDYFLTEKAEVNKGGMHLKTNDSNKSCCHLA